MTQSALPKSPPAVPAGEPIWTDLITPTPQQTRDFYAALFGWEYQISQELGGYANAHIGGKKAAGISPPPPQGLDAQPSWRIYFASGDIHADAAQIVDLGGQALFEPMQIGDRGQLGVFTDAGAAPFGLWQDDQHGGFVQYTGPGRLVWCEYNTRDAAKALGFYTALFHATSQKVPTLEYHTLHHENDGFAGVSGFGEHWEAVSADGWMVYFYAPDVDETAEVAQRHGGKILVEPWDMLYGRMAVLADPAGAVFSVMTPQPGPSEPGPPATPSEASS